MLKIKFFILISSEKEEVKLLVHALGGKNKTAASASQRATTIGVFSQRRKDVRRDF